jgi:hypothetical protein
MNLYRPTELNSRVSAMEARLFFVTQSKEIEMDPEETVTEEPKVDYKPERRAYGYLSMAIGELQEGKPNDRSDADRRFAIVITELEKSKAILKDFLLG